MVPSRYADRALQYWSLGAPVSDTGVMQSRATRLGPRRSSGERRDGTRFPLGLDLHYTVLSVQEPHETGSGRVLDVSRTGVRFTADRPLDIGLKVELAIHWPVLLDGAVQLQLALWGSIVWAEGDEAAMEILRYEFRTRGGQLKSA